MRDCFGLPTDHTHPTSHDKSANASCSLHSLTVRIGGGNKGVGEVALIVKTRIAALTIPPSPILGLHHPSVPGLDLVSRLATRRRKPHSIQDGRSAVRAARFPRNTVLC